ncbi:structural maintenance of chromosomes protein 3-like [Anopheles marshallii]|uniref:structural maintenance of chromosomes protein 3-like n=1 Tax=Anopheles marshallii TaxID=1521116 RepID=UPI00237A9F99|nr:structural maintenance of chromosomes protein 3-like [Anopheles marshallii]
MYLKEIIINGFKSYTHETVVEQLDPRHNVVVGRNGSGKSNFFSAIEFVLSDEYNNLRQSERVGLINKGASKTRTSFAFVEIVLEKTSIPSENNPSEVRIRRIISATKDQYKLNGRNATRKEVVETLDSIGVSTCIPYYIVKQGKINQLAMARPPQLLQVLLEIGGIRVYDEKLKETMKLMQDADKCLNQTRIECASLAERLKFLTTERKEQEKFEQLEKKQRKLTFMVLQKQRTVSATALQELRQMENAWEEKQRLYVLQKSEAFENANVLKTNRKENQIALRNALSQQSCLNEKHCSLQKQKAQLELQIKDLEHKQSYESYDQKSKQTQLDTLVADIAQVQQDLKQVSDELKLTQERIDEYKSQLLKKREMRNEIIDKQRRGIQFSNRKDRDHFLKQEIDYVLDQIDKKHEILLETDKEHDIVLVSLESEKNNGAQEEAELALLLKKEQTYKERIMQIRSRLQESKILLEELFGDEIKLKEDLQYFEAQRTDQEQTIRKQIGARAFQGSQSVSKILDMLKTQAGENHPVVSGYYGQVWETFQCEEAIYQAVETTAGNKLYYHIVESDTVANEIIALYNKNKLPGEFNFLPLNRLEAKPLAATRDEDKAVQSLIHLLGFKPKYELAFRHIFGKTLLCDGLEVATNASKQYRQPCVTREGDLISSGTITGGYRAPGSSKVRELLHMRGLNEKISLLKNKLQSTSKHIREIQTFIYNDETQRTAEETKLRRLSQKIEQIQIRVSTFSERCRKLEEKCEEKERKIRALKTDLEILSTKENSLKRELSTQFVSVLSEEDELIIAQLDNEIRILKQQQNEAFIAELHVQKRKHKLENKLNSKLIPTRDALIASLKCLDCATLKQQMELYQQQQDTLTAKINSLLQDITVAEKQVHEMTDKEEKLIQELDYWLQKLKKAEEVIAIKDPHLIKYETRKSKIEQDISQYAEQINALGVLPAVEPIYQKMSLPKLMKELDQTNRQIGKFSSVNRAAVNEHMKVSQAFKALNQKLKETEDSRALHETSIQHLRAQRVDCIENIFTKVNANFSATFSKFVPTGCGRLILQTTDNVEEEENDEHRNDAVPDRYVGLELKVSFMSSKGALNDMQSLSGGQKTLVAVALIFALQQYNPAPFYLFDELDQALDSQYRKVIANEIHTLSENSQFITITFRRELLEHADKFFGVRYQNNFSHIGPVSKQQAFNFVVDDAIEK